eukprot:1614-Eustigmatos_ZCMA.PRE.1
MLAPINERRAGLTNGATALDCAVGMEQKGSDACARPRYVDCTPRVDLWQLHELLLQHQVAQDLRCGT